MVRETQSLVHKNYENKIRELRILELQKGNDKSMSWLINKYLRIGLIAWANGKSLPKKNEYKMTTTQCKRFIVYDDVFEGICQFRAFYLIKKRKLGESDAVDRLFRLGFENKNEYHEEAYDEKGTIKKPLKELINNIGGVE